MKLICLYIENFGGLSKFDLNFEAGLTTINQPNGFGKTTLAEFIRAMLYGFPRKTKTLEKNRRQRYAPWNGGSYGGNLVFEHEGQRYRIERTFGASLKGDTFALIDLATNRKSNRFSEEIGIELFGLDSDSFERSTYLPQMREEGTLSTAIIQAKLNDLVEDSNDVANYDKAIALLKTKRSALIPYRGSGGTVAEASARISQLQLQLDQALLQKTQLEEAQKNEKRTKAEIEATQTALEQARGALAEAAEMSAMVAQQRQYQQLQAQHRQASMRIKNCRDRYSLGFPDEETLSSAEAMADRWAILTAQTGQSGRAQLPSMEEINDCRWMCEEFAALQQNNQKLQASASELMQEARQHQEAKKNLLSCWILGIISLFCLVAGAPLMLKELRFYGAIGLAVGAVAAVTATAIYLARRKKRRTLKKALDEKLHTVQQEIRASLEKSNAYRNQISQFLFPYFGKTEPPQFLACLIQLERDTQLDVQAQQRNAEAEKCRSQLERFFLNMGCPMEQDVRAQLRRLREDIRDVQTAQTTQRMLEAQLAALEETCGDLLLAELHATGDPRQLKLEEQQLRDSLTRQTEQLIIIRQRIQLLRAQVDQIGSLWQALEHWKQRLDQDRENVRILDDTMSFLQLAKDKLSTSYLGTIQSRFGHYLTQLEGRAGENYFIDTDFQIQLERMGRARELAYFSAGQADLVMLCMRLALVDALFKGQETFVILDDPFVNLDDAHTAQAQRLLRKLSGERQILYLTCHSSRTIPSRL